MKEEKKKKVSFSQALKERQSRYDEFHYQATLEELEAERKKILRAIVMLDSLTLSDKDKREMSDRLYTEKRENEAKINNYGQR